MSTETPQKLPGIPDIPADQRTPAVVRLLELCHRQQEQIQALRDEVARLKGQNPKPVIKPSALEGPRWSLQTPPPMATQTPPGRIVEIVMQSIAAGRFFYPPLLVNEEPVTA